MNNAKKIRGLEKDLEGIMQELEEVLIFEIERMFELGIKMKMTSAPYAYIDYRYEDEEDKLCVCDGTEYYTLENAALSDLQLLYHLGKMQEDEQGKK
jgi:hypothetical protein